MNIDGSFRMMRGNFAIKRRHKKCYCDFCDRLNAQIDMRFGIGDYNRGAVGIAICKDCAKKYAEMLNEEANK